MTEKGCQHWPDCFTCPFFDCILSLGHPRAKSIQARRRRIQRLLEYRMPVGEIARTLGISKVTVYRHRRALDGEN